MGEAQIIVVVGHGRTVSTGSTGPATGPRARLPGRGGLRDSCAAARRPCARTLDRACRRVKSGRRAAGPGGDDACSAGILAGRRLRGARATGPGQRCGWSTSPPPPGCPGRPSTTSSAARKVSPARWCGGRPTAISTASSGPLAERPGDAARAAGRGRRVDRRGGARRSPGAGRCSPAAGASGCPSPRRCPRGAVARPRCPPSGAADAGAAVAGASWSRPVRDRAVAALDAGCPACVRTAESRRRWRAAASWRSRLALVLWSRPSARAVGRAGAHGRGLGAVGERVRGRRQCDEPESWRPITPTITSADRDDLEGGDEVAEEDHAVDRGARRADARPHRVRRADVELLQGERQQAEAAQGEGAEGDGRPQLVKPCESLRQTAKPVSSSPATTTSSHAMVCASRISR